MAAKPPKPPGTVLASQEGPDPYICFQKTKSDCSCTNISIMQLFHEMKQEFPTIPDYVVSQYVFDNCHEREKCIEHLKQKLIGYPVQAYPSHVLRNNPNLMCNKLPDPTKPGNFSCNSETVNSSPKIAEDKTSNNISLSGMQPHEQTNQNQTNTTPQRPSTLNFYEDLNNEHFFNNRNQRSASRPVRTAPLPPARMHVSANVQNADQGFNSSLIQSPVNYSDSGDSEISVNISLSPSSELSRRARRISTISIQPEPPYSRDFSPQSPRSFTSLNLTLRKPSRTPQSPIDITAGPGLTYSSSSFDARRGYQKNFHITVNDKGGVFSASRIRPRNCTIDHEEEEYFSDYQHSNLSTTPSENDVGYKFTIPVEPHATSFSIEKDHSEILERQRLKMQNLLKDFEMNRKELKREQQQIQILTSPLNHGEAKRLDSRIKELSGGCLEMLNIIEQSGYVSYDAMDNEQSTFLGQRPLPPLPLHMSANSAEDDAQSLFRQTSPSDPSENNKYPNVCGAEGEPPWTCSMCTFQNHPLLNKCECCDNIRIIPGTIRIVPSNHSNSSPLFSRLSSSLTSINNNVNRTEEPINCNNTESYPAVIVSPPNQNCIMPGNG